MKILKIFPDNPNERHIDYAVDSLLDGNVIIYPTDTLYAFGCDALNNSAVGKICELKKLRTDKISLSIICFDIAQAAEYADSVDVRIYIYCGYRCLFYRTYASYDITEE